jgi:flagellar hook assembly protein FlgD
LNIPAKAFDPYSGETFPIEFGAEYDDRAILRIYNAEGKLKKTLVNTIIENSNGISYCTWNGKDRENNLVPLGLYICYLEVTDVNTGRKKTAKAPIVIGSQLK